MNTVLLLLATLLAVSTTVIALEDATEKIQLSHKSKKKSKKKKDKDPLYADIESLIDDDDDDDMADMSGWVSLEYNDDDEMVIDYSISSGPKRCDTCKLAIYDGDSCDDLGDPYYDTEENPWTKDDTPYITNKKRRAAGFFKTDNGYSYSKNECKFVVLFDEDKDDDRRNLSSNERGLKHKSKGPKKLACGQLIPDGAEDDDYC